MKNLRRPCTSCIGILKSFRQIDIIRIQRCFLLICSEIQGLSTGHGWHHLWLSNINFCLVTFFSSGYWSGHRQPDGKWRIRAHCASHRCAENVVSEAGRVTSSTSERLDKSDRGDNEYNRQSFGTLSITLLNIPMTEKPSKNKGILI